MELVLGVETSCDETAIGLYSHSQGLLANQIYSQVEMHSPYGGVVPELAARDHIKKILPLIEQALQHADVSKHDLTGIAFTRGPGLVGALMVGAALGRSLAFALDIPAVGVHHLEAHLLAVMLESHKPSYPFVALLVSGGHTMLIEVTAFGSYQLLGQTLDDAVGEAFDKTAKLLGLGYPGGPALAELAKLGDESHFRFPRPMVDRPGCDFSFSGLKTYAMNCFRKEGNDEQTKADIACSFQQAVVDTLIIKCTRALKQTGHKRLVLAGGVSANQSLRTTCDQQFGKKGCEVFYPRPEFCTDNGAMVAYCGYLRLLNGQSDDLNIQVKPKWPLELFME